MHETSELCGTETIISYQEDISEVDSSGLELKGILEATYSDWV